MRNSSLIFTAVALAVFGSTGSDVLADLPPDVRSLEPIGTSFEIEFGSAERESGPEWIHHANTVTHDGCCALEYHDPVIGDYSSTRIWGHSIDAGGVTYAVMSDLRHSCLYPEGPWEVYSRNTVSSTYRLKTTGTQAITLTMNLLSNGERYTQGEAWYGCCDGLDSASVDLSDTGLYFRRAEDTGWTRAALGVMAEESTWFGQRIRKVRSTIQLGVGEYILMIRSRSTTFSSVPCEEIQDINEITLGFEATSDLPPGLSMISHPAVLAGAKVLDAFTEEILETGSVNLMESWAEAGEELDESTPLAAEARAIFGGYTRTHDAYGYHFLGEGAIRIREGSDAFMDHARRIAVSATADIQFVAEDPMRLHLSFPSWLESDWDTRTFGVTLRNLESGELIEPMRAWDHGRQYTFQVASGSYQMIHTYAMERIVHGKSLQDDQGWKDQVDAHLLFRKLGDTNGDGSINGGDLAMLLATWGQQDPTMSLDAVDLIDGRDLSVLLANWGI